MNVDGSARNAEAERLLKEGADAMVDGDLATAEVQFVRARAICAELGKTQQSAHCSANLGLVYQATGLPHDAETAMKVEAPQV